MRKWLVPFIVLLFALAGCSQAGGVGAGSLGSAAPRKGGIAAPVNKYNPCELVKAEDVSGAFPKVTSVNTLTAEGYDPSDPPTNGMDSERNCSYTVTVSGMFGDNPTTDSTAQFNVTVTTYAAGNGGWAAKVEGAQTASTSDTPFRRVVNVGDDAFFFGRGNLTATKGGAIIQVRSDDDVNGVMTDAAARRIVLKALARV